jgi:hypothetical protein
VLTTALFIVAPLHAQNFTSDARRIAMGAIGDADSDASKLAGDAREYRSIGAPLGLLQVFKNPKVFLPTEDDFNPLRAMELAASPVHYTLNRSEGGPGDRLVTDLIKANFSRNLAAYKGFTPSPRIDAAGLLSPRWGKTFKLVSSGDADYQGIFIGAGPYVSIGTSLTIDQALINFLGDPNAPAPANTSYLVGNNTGLQGAVALTGGYRAKVPVSFARGSGSKRNGLYVATNFNYLRGIRYESANINVTIETDNTGQVTLTPSSIPVTIDRLWAERGKGFSIDMSTMLVTDRFNAGFAVEGLGNRIDWEELASQRFELSALSTGVDFAEVPLAFQPTGTVRVTLPVRYSATGGVRLGGLSSGFEYRHGMQRQQFHAGAEYALLFLEFRGGMRYTRPSWNPSGGIGLNITRRLGIDLAAFGTTTNVERARKMAVALSLRINKVRSE